ncbi:hypothetical protein [Salinicoccus albus]|uniref:hypothetical protein n=1 Tax=Salinicoccus albus TaxID=418756 RepID=UPI00036ECB9B|nr:hypothetical protein [Salinicoccus albus]
MNEEATIINIASVGQAELDFDDLNTQNNYDGFLVCSRSKLVLIMFTFDLAEKLRSEVTDVNANHPATLMDTNMVKAHFGSSQSSVEQGLDAVTSLATTEDVTGQFYDGKNRSKALNQADEKEARKKLKSITEDNLSKYM